MSFFGLGDIFKGITGLFGGGGGNGGLGNLLAGQLTAQRIPGQTKAGEYTPSDGSFATYNYIPTGATQIDPTLIQSILRSGQFNTDSGNVASQLNNRLFNTGAGSYGSDGYPNTMDNLGKFAYDASQALVPLAQQYQQQGGQVWNAGQNQLANYANLFGLAQNNPLTSNYISGAQSIGQGMQNVGQQLQNTAGNYLGGVQGQVNSLLSNPYQQLAQMGGNQAGSMLQNTGTSGYNQGQAFSNQAASNLPAANAVLNTAFDPQQQLYNRSLGQTQDQIGVQLARMGLTDSGAGGKIASDALNNFNIDWQNNQLGRQATGLQSYGSAMTNAGNNLAQGQNLQSGAAGTYAQGAQMPFSTYQNLGATQLGNLGALGTAATQSAYALPAAGGLQQQGNAAGYNAYNTDLSNQLGYANAYGQGAGQLSNTYGQMGSALNNNVGIDNQLLQMRGLAAGIPQQTVSNYLNNTAGISNLNNQNVGQMLQYLDSVMRGSANASNAASGAQSATVNQNANAAAGLSPLINGGLSWLSNLLGGGGSGGGGSGGGSNVFNQVMQF